MKKKQNIKYLSFGLIKTGAVNFTGHKTLLNRSKGKNKRKYRLIDFYRLSYEIPSIVLRIDYDPNRSANIALICYKNGFMSYIISVKGLCLNKFLNVKYPTVGVANKINAFNIGTFISCIELRSGFGAKLTRAAGCFSIIIGKIDNKKIIIRLSSGEYRYLFGNNKASIGIVSNVNHFFKKMSKAGDNFHKGFKPIVRGVAKNSVDHPHGGGRGKTSPWSTAVNFSNRVLKGVSKLKKRKNNFIILNK